MDNEEGKSLSISEKLRSFYEKLLEKLDEYAPASFVWFCILALIIPWIVGTIIIIRWIF